jgi:hypothetical protein
LGGDAVSIAVDLFRTFSVLNLVLALTLGIVWGRNYRRFRSKHTLGLLVFALFFLLENGLAVYFFLFEPTLSVWIDTPDLVPPIAQYAMSSLRVLEFGGLAFITWITWD